MTSAPERTAVITLIQEANAAGARLFRACDEAGISLRTYRRWYRDGMVQQDKRPMAIRPAPANKLSIEEREAIVVQCNRPEYSHLPPSQIVPDLLDRGIYIASESSFYRVLSEVGQLHHRGQWVDRFVHWYNTEHKHSQLNFVTPQQRHMGEDTALLAQRKMILEQAKQNHPSRWGARSVRNCEPVGSVTLNPEKETDMQQAA